MATKRKTKSTPRQTSQVPQKRSQPQQEAATGFTRRKERSKADIRQAAWELFSQFGVAKTGVADIARKAGVSPATIYNNFGSKEALVREFVADAVDRLVERAQAQLAPGKRYREKMVRLIQFIGDQLAGEAASAANAPMFASSIDLQADPEIRKIREAAQDRMADLLLDLVREGKRQREVDLHLPEEALRIYFKLFMDIFTDARLQHEFRRDPGLVPGLGALMMYGLRGRR